ncbi:hypothetical protein CC80DRAFT_587760 [Byssothecium circinans]|uniref:Rhodopsin domain-containing protein n=1 Tax=Byssothecium circinans TaxID=147558 RepID=A0A6A5UEZ3_9PLEO|nr:hypothetical protein CC80DRAFT_587760 [Byssothecium circinans]
MAGDFPNLDPTSISHWPKPNNVDPETRSWFLAFSVCLMVLTTIVFLLRISAQAKTRNAGLGLDDGLMFCAWVFAVLLTVACFIGTLEYGFDRHLWDVDSALYSRAALVQWLSEGAFVLSTTLTKISVLCFYRRLDPPCTTAFRRAIYVFIALTGCYSIACILAQILLCHPTSAYWTIAKSHLQPEKKCASQRLYYAMQGVLDTTSTAYTIAILYFGLRDVPMILSHRSTLKVIFICSFSVVVAAIARTVFLACLVNSVVGDATWNGFNVFVSAQLECQLAIIFASLPYLHSYISHGHSVRNVFYNNNSNRNDSVMSKISSSLSSPFKRLSFARSISPRNLQISPPRPQTQIEIPEWNGPIHSPRHQISPSSPVDEITYEQYVRGNFGPPAPPKDLGLLFDEHKREHGVLV